MARHKDRNHLAYIARRGLVETRDPEIGRPVLRKPGFAGISPLGDMESALSRAMRAKRTECKLTREQLAAMVGLSAQVFGGYEKAISKMHVTRLIHLCEILDASPVDMIHAAAPHLFGDSMEEAKIRADTMSALFSLPPAAVAALQRVIVAMIPEPREDSTPSDNDRQTKTLSSANASSSIRPAAM
jgi:transcriptional regulator with XRE-family HTH domain